MKLFKKIKIKTSEQLRYWNYILPELKLNGIVSVSPAGECVISVPEFESKTITF